MPYYHGGGIRLVAEPRKDESFNSKRDDIRDGIVFNGYSDGKPGEGILLKYTVARQLVGTDEKFVSSLEFRIIELQAYWRIHSKPKEAKYFEPEELKTLGDFISRPSPYGDPPKSANKLPAAYTYIGQFIAHDLSHLELDTDGKDINLSTPALDLSALFNGAKKGPPWTGKTFGVGRLRDLPRRNDSGEARISDARNDHNLALAQVHTIIARFYEIVVNEVTQDMGEAERITKHFFQYAVVHDYLTRLIDCDTWKDVMSGNRLLVNQNVFLVPIEFALACFKFGHSMVHGTYKNWRGTQGIGPKGLMSYTWPGGLINSQVPALTDSWVMPWRRMLGVAEELNYSRSISVNFYSMTWGT